MVHTYTLLGIYKGCALERVWLLHRKLLPLGLFLDHDYQLEALPGRALGHNYPNLFK